MLGASIGLSGCAQITVISDNQLPASEWKFGVLKVDVAPSTDNAIVSASGLGVISSPIGTAVGYSRAKVVRIGNDCRVVITADDLNAINNDEALLRHLKSMRKACAT